MPVDSDFKKDITDFLNLINSAKNTSDVKKAYISLVKKYHPDSAPQELQSQFNEYMILINKVYSQGKTKVQEIKIDDNEAKQSVKPKTKATPKVYTFKDYYGREKRYTDYLEYIMHFGVTEFDIGLIIENFGNYEASYMRNAHYLPNDYSHFMEAMQHFYNASKCFNYIIKNHPDYIFYDYVKEQLAKVNEWNNYLSKYVADSDSKELML